MRVSDFYPRSPRGERHGNNTMQFMDYAIFLSTLPARGATKDFIVLVGALAVFLSTLPARGATYTFPGLRRARCHFYPRSPRGERLCAMSTSLGTLGFLSTLPARGATNCRLCPVRGFRFLSTLPARGATIVVWVSANERTDFYPRSPRGERLSCCRAAAAPCLISIHAPREGSDPSPDGQKSFTPHFYPRSPRGERLTSIIPCWPTSVFLSTLPARGATGTPTSANGCQEFLSTLPARGATSTASCISFENVLFLSTLPARGATHPAG